MTHLVSPTAFRAGKTALWNANVIVPGSAPGILISATQFAGISQLIKHKLRRKRLLTVKSSLFSLKATLQCRVLFMPRVKTRPVADGKGLFSRHVLYKRHCFKPNFYKQSRLYVDQRRLKIFKFPKPKFKQINKWLSRRMLRGNDRNNIFWRKRFRSTQTPKGSLHYSSQRRILQNIKKVKYNTRWHTSRLKLSKGIDCQKLSYAISNTLNHRCNVIAVNVFGYLVTKQMLGFRSHQEHLWNKNFRKYRFFYDNYYDVVNSFFILGLIKNSESLLLNILRLMMPRIRKIKRFMMFLDSVLKHMPQIQNKFLCFRIVLAGKIRGGTQRTKTLSVGFGHLPYQSLNIQGSTAFTSYPHKYWEFGITLIMARF